MKLSIVIPAHNEQDNITDIINKIENTLDIPHELIVVNDHSADKTPGLVRRLSERYSKAQDTLKGERVLAVPGSRVFCPV